MTIVLDGTSGITTPTYGGNVTAEYTVPVTAFKNRIINGAMVIDQRNAGASVNNIVGNAYPVDRFTLFGTEVDKLALQQNAGSVTPPAGFVNYLGATSLSSYSSISGSIFVVSQFIEGYNTADFAWGTANAATVTLSFWVRSSLTGTFSGSLNNSANSRSYIYTYTISTANTWEYKTITISGDTTGTWLTNNGRGIAVRFDLGCGSTYRSSTTGWQSGGVYGLTGTQSVVGTNGATFYTTGVQLEVGSTATSFDYRPYGTELQLCQRYYQQWGGNSGNERLAVGFMYATTQCRVDIPLVVTMRSTPTLTVSAAADWAIEGNFGAAACNSISLDQPSPRVCAANFNTATVITSGMGVHIMANGTGNARFNLSSEL